ncbi:MAG: redox-regulated ATPase YchF [bacterium]
MKLGIVGLPNVGKSTVFNALTENAVSAENYPFCTVDPNVGVVEVPDRRLFELSKKVNSEKVTPATVQFLDIAGLVENAHQGEGLGNQFLGQIRDVDALCHVLRLFSDPDVSHVAGELCPRRDLQIIETEFALADLEMLEKRIEKLEKKVRVGQKEVEAELQFLSDLARKLAAGDKPDPATFSEQEKQFLKGTPLLSCKPVLYVLNVDEQIFKNPTADSNFQQVIEIIENRPGARYVILCAKLEAEMAGMQPAEKRMFLEELGAEQPGLNRLIRAAHETLDLITFFTYNENKLRAWSIKRGSKAPRAAGKVHSDLEKGFIRAQTINYEDFENYESWQQAREDGMVRSEGKDYVVRDGDILLIKFNV